MGAHECVTSSPVRRLLLACLLLMPAVVTALRVDDAGLLGIRYAYGVNCAGEDGRA